MARYPDDPNNYSDDEPTAYSNYGDYGGHEPPGPLPEPEVPWYRKPAALVAIGALGAAIVALVVYALVNLVSGDSSDPTTTTTTPTTRRRR